VANRLFPLRQPPEPPFGTTGKLGTLKAQKDLEQKVGLEQYLG